MNEYELGYQDGYAVNMNQYDLGYQDGYVQGYDDGYENEDLEDDD